jgi:type II secretory ATPase GspE/PulE/Tfp pilus assembly ATPase PilB-like protein
MHRAWRQLATSAAAILLAAAPAWAAVGDVRPENATPVSVVKLVLLGVLFVLTALCGNWVAKDVPIHRKQENLWYGVFVGAAALALVAALVVPVAGLGILLGFVVLGVTMAVYVNWRNQQVAPNARAFTPDHIRKSILKMMRREQDGEIAAERAVHVASAARMKLTEDSELIYMKTNDMPIRLTPQSDEEIAVISRGEKFLTRAITRYAGEIYLLPQGPNTQLRMREVGVLTDGGTVDKATGDGIIAFFKQLAGLDVNDHRKPQMGRFIARLGEKSTNITVQTSGSVKGEHLVAKLHSHDLLKMRLVESGMREAQVLRLKTAMEHSGGGVILMSAPKHHGRTVSMYAALRELDLFSRNVVAVEDEISIEVTDVRQEQVDRKAGQTLATTVQAMLRTDPDVVMVETIGDADTAQMMLTGAAVGKIMIGGLVANDVTEAVESFMKLVGNRQNVAATLLAVTNQRLLRTLCSACREAYRPNPDFLRKANLETQQVNVLYREPKTRPTNKKGETLVCPMCENEGYVGRTALYEVVALDDHARKELQAGRSVAEIRTMLRKQDQQFLQEEGLYKVVDGTTSVPELLRVLKPAQ